MNIMETIFVPGLFSFTLISPEIYFGVLYLLHYVALHVKQTDNGGNFLTKLSLFFIQVKSW